MGSILDYNEWLNIYIIDRWQILGAWEYIEQTRDMVHDLEQRVQKAKDNVETIGKYMQTWNKLPLFERKKEGKTDHMLNLDDRNDRINKRYNEIRDVGTKVHALVKVRKILHCTHFCSEMVLVFCE